MHNLYVHAFDHFLIYKNYLSRIELEIFSEIYIYLYCIHTPCEFIPDLWLLKNIITRKHLKMYKSV